MHGMGRDKLMNIPTIGDTYKHKSTGRKFEVDGLTLKVLLNCVEGYNYEGVFNEELTTLYLDYVKVETKEEL